MFDLMHSIYSPKLINYGCLDNKINKPAIIITNTKNPIKKIKDST